MVADRDKMFKFLIVLFLSDSMEKFQTFEEFRAEAEKIMYEAKQIGIPLKLMGGAAIRIHCPNSEELYSKLGRIPGHDLDFASSQKYAKKIKEMFKGLGYFSYSSPAFNISPQSKYRQIYVDKDGNQVADVFLNRFIMCHTIEFEKRLGIDDYTLPLAELLLQKLQIVEINEKDVKDIIILLREHEVGEDDNETVNSEYLAKILSGDWGFYFTTTTNLQKTRDLIRSYGESGLLDKADQAVVNSRMDLLIQKIEDEPKSLKWKLRSRVGTSKQWYEKVEEVKRDHLQNYTP